VKAAMALGVSLEQKYDRPGRVGTTAPGIAPCLAHEKKPSATSRTDFLCTHCP
jgi:hypothetical protein